MVKATAIPNLDLVVAIDLGASQTKVIAKHYPQRTVQITYMEPEVADVARESLQEFKTDGAPENCSWVGIGNDYYAVGFLARHQFGGNSMLRQLKYEVAIPKICAVLWVLKQKLQLPNKFKVALSVLLPPAEARDMALLEVKLKAALQSFETPSGTIRVKAALFNAMQEGIGILAHRRTALAEDFKTLTIVVAMLGYRNASVFVSARGLVSPGLSSEFGMAWMIDSFVRRCSGLSKDDPRIVQTLWEAGEECSKEILAKLSRKQKPEEQEADGVFMQAAAMRSRDDYVRAITRWLRQQLPPEVDEIILCGGTAEYLQPELEQHFSKNTLIWHGGVELPSQLHNQEITSRIADVWGLYNSFVERVEKMTNSTSNQDSSHQSATTISEVKPSAKPKGFLEMPEQL